MKRIVCGPRNWVWGILHQVFSTPGEFYTKKSGYFYTREFYTIFSFFVRKILLFWCRILLVQNSPGVKIPTFQRILHQEISTPKPNKVFLHHFSFFFPEKNQLFSVQNSPGVEITWCIKHYFQTLFFHETSNTVGVLFCT